MHPYRLRPALGRRRPLRHGDDTSPGRVDRRPRRGNDVPVVLAFDGDMAGQAAALKAWDLLAVSAHLGCGWPMFLTIVIQVNSARRISQRP